MIDSKRDIWYNTSPKGGVAVPRSESLRRAQEKYSTEKLTQLKIYLNKEDDKDVIEHMKRVPNKAAYIKSLIRKDMEKSGK